MKGAHAIPARFANDWQGIGLAPLRAMRAFGMRRSGNHAIADWILRNVGGSGSVFLNNCMPAQSPLTSFRAIEVNRQRIPTDDARANLPASCAPAGPAATILITYEDIPPAGQDMRAISGDLEEGFDADIIIYRSFLNWSASLLKKLQKNKRFANSRRAGIMMRAFGEYSRMLGYVSEADALSLTPICYDDWLASEVYRANRLTGLGLSSLDNSIGATQPYGGGSSFQGSRADADDLATDRRFEQMADDPDYRAVLTIAARDSDLMTRVKSHFPQDVERLSEWVGGQS
ncbi:MAG: hypothetical protein AB3N23_00970 [Paracoccaceae bacterium]